MNSFKSQTRLLIGTGALALALVVVGSPVLASAETLTRQLQLGMSGADVSVLQTFLARDNTIYPQGLVTGYFGSLTKSAVSNFQARNGIATVGRVGPQTLVVINAQMGGGSSVGTERTAPSIYGTAVSVTNTSATLNWNTNENASSVLYYNTSPISMIESSANTGVTIGGSSVLVHADLRSSHTTTLTSLLPSTTYYYVVYVRDVSGNESISWPATFRTN